MSESATLVEQRPKTNHVQTIIRGEFDGARATLRRFFDALDEHDEIATVARRAFERLEGAAIVLIDGKATTPPAIQLAPSGDGEIRSIATSVETAAPPSTSTELVPLSDDQKRQDLERLAKKIGEAEKTEAPAPEDNLSERIRDYRVRKNISQDRLGKIVGLAQHQISALELGRSREPSAVAKVIALLDGKAKKSKKHAVDFHAKHTLVKKPCRGECGYSCRGSAIGMHEKSCEKFLAKFGGFVPKKQAKKAEKTKRARKAKVVAAPKIRRLKSAS